MSELKRIFKQALMNKDLDERLVPNGQYREAHNIEISTSEGSEVGTVQTLFGNTERNQVIQNHPSLNNNSTYSSTTYATMGENAYNFMGPHNKASVVGTVANANTDKIYYLVDGGEATDSTAQFGVNSGGAATTYNAAKDYIIEYDTVNNVSRYVFVDIYNVFSEVRIDIPSSESTTFHVVGHQGQPSIPPGFRVGMQWSSVNNVNVPFGYPVGNSEKQEIVNVEYDADAIFDGLTGYWKITLNKPHLLSISGYGVQFHAEPVLDFYKRRLITGINILDDFLFWTDNLTEPKKINITRSIAGTGGYVELNTTGSDSFPANDIFFGDTDYFHTRLVKDKSRIINPLDSLSKYDVVINAAQSHPVYVTEEHVTVIRKAPTQPLELEMYRTGAKRVTSEGVENATYGVISNLAWVDDAGELLESGAPVNGVVFDNDIDIRVGDIILISIDDVSVSPNTFQDHIIRAEVTSGGVTDGQQDNISNGPFSLEILSISPSTLTPTTSEDFGLGPWYVKLEDKKPMFENRFPRFSYRYKYQDGEYSAFAPWSQIAFLPDRYEYFPKKGYNLGMVNQLRGLKLRYYHHDEDIIPQDVTEVDILYKEAGKANVYTVKTIKPDVAYEDTFLWPDLSMNPSSRGVFEIKSDMIHAVVPSNQILRPWDNVPRKALAQEVSANRLIYGNYVQNYHVVDKPMIQVGYEQTKLTDSYYFPQQGYAYPSVKTMRKYQVGVVFSDRYGRETPVLTHENAAVTVPKIASDTRNRLKVNFNQKFTTYPSWSEYMTWYVKETSIEYYTMAMDRWYNASDGNIWISFPSSDRNKLDDETFIVLKKAHGTSEAVKEKARYRILAIENEAPDFIKTEKKSLGIIFNGSSNVIGPDGNGYPFQDSTYIYIDNTPGVDSFSNVYGDLWLLPPDTMMVRFYGAGTQSDEYEITRVIKQGNVVRLNLKTKIGEDASFISTNDTFEGAITDLSMEIIEHEVENKPEFDGKFFVKIYKDEILEQFVLMPTEQQYQVVNAQEVGYLANNGFAGLNSQTGSVGFDTYMLRSGNESQYSGNYAASTGYAVAGATTVGTAFDISAGGARNVAGTAWHPTEHFHHFSPAAAGGLAEAAYTWGQGDSGVVDINNEVIDSSCIFSATSAKQVNHNAILALNDGGGNGAFSVQSPNDCRQFWNDVCAARTFFIDSCTAYTYCEGTTGGSSENLTIPGLANGQANFDGNNQVYFGYSSGVTGGAVGSVPANNSDGYGGENNPRGASFKDNKGQPSRGIWEMDGEDDISYMDISWSGMGSTGSNHPGMWGDSNEDWNDVTEDNGITHRIGDVLFVANPDWTSMSEASAASGTAEFQAAQDFISQLVAPNTTFRFNRDPDNTVYTVLNGGFPVLEGNDTGYQNAGVFHSNTSSITDGVYGIRNYRTSQDTTDLIGNDAKQIYETECMRQRWTLAVSPKIGSGPHGYNPITGTNGYELLGGVITALAAFEDDPINAQHDNHRRALRHDLTPPYDLIQILSPYTDSSEAGTFTDKPGIWETEPKESVELDIYYQASGLHPLILDNSTNEEYLPIRQGNNLENLGGTRFRLPAGPIPSGQVAPEQTYTVTGFNGQTITFTPAIVTVDPLVNGQQIKFTKRNSYSITGRIDMPDGPPQIGDTTMILHGGPGSGDIDPAHHLSNQVHWLDWNNCWAFGNGVESDRIRDDFNAAQMDNGVKASSVLAGQITEERRKHGLIWSGIYNSTSGVNNTNQFIAAEKITKDLNPVYGSIQALLNRDTRLVVFCEDKILRAVTNKDALYNADGNPQLISSNRVVGDTTPYLGDYGISTNPESLVATASNVYFSDVVRGKVLALGNQGDGVRVISDVGMKDYFGDLFSENVWRSIGSYDERKKEYNLSVYKKYGPNYVQPYNRETISYSELSKGWMSFKSFYPQQGISLNNSYYTFDNGSMFEHHINTNRNNFYNVQGVVNGGTMDSYSVTLDEANISIETGMIVSGNGIVGYPTVTAVENTIITLSATQSISNDVILSFNPVSDVTILFNDQPNIVKSFMTLNYEGSQAKIPAFRILDAHKYGTTTDNWLSGDYSNNSGVDSGVAVTDSEYFNLADKTGWYAESVTTNMQECENTYFKNKEDKYFGYLTGQTTDYTNEGCTTSTLSNNLDEREFSVQGIGLASITHDDSTAAAPVCLTFANNIVSTYEGDDETGGVWDTAADLAEDASRWTCTSQTVIVPSGALIGYNVTSQTPQFNGATSGTVIPGVNEIGTTGVLHTSIPNIVLTISPNDASDNPTGALLSADNFSIGGGNNAFGTTWVNTSGGASVDPDTGTSATAASFQFADTGTAGTESNTIKVYIQLSSLDNFPTSDDTWYIDIDETLPEDPNTDVDPTVETRKVCFRTQHHHMPEQMADEVLVYDVTTDSSLDGNDGVVYGDCNIVESLITQGVNPAVELLDENDQPSGLYTSLDEGGGVAAFTHHQFEGVVIDGQQNLVAELEWQAKPIYFPNPGASSGLYIQSYYYFATPDDVQNLVGFSYSGMEVYGDYYSVEMVYGPTTDTNDWFTNEFGTVLHHFKARVYYTPPPEEMLPDSSGSMCSLNPGPHTISFRTVVQGFLQFDVNQGLDGNALPEITSVIYNRDAGFNSRSTAIRILGRSGGACRLFVTRATSVTNNTIESYYDFDTGTFGAASNHKEVYIGNNGNYVCQVALPPDVDTKSYNIHVEPLISSATNVSTVIAAGVPTTIGAATITKHGTRSITITPTTATAANFGTLPTKVIRDHVWFEGRKSTKKRGSTHSFTARGGNNSKSSTKLTIERNVSGIAVGMLVNMRNTNIIPHNTKVVSVRESIVTLSAAVSVPTGSSIKFRSNSQSLVPFSLTIPPGSGKTFSLNSNINVQKSIDINTGISSQVNGAVSNNKTITLDSVRGINPLMVVTGTGIAGGGDTVVSVDLANSRILLSSNQTLDDEVLLKFVWVEDSYGLDGYDPDNGANRNVKIDHAQTSLEDGKLKVEGYIDVRYIKKTAPINIYIDDLVNVR